MHNRNLNEKGMSKYKLYNRARDANKNALLEKEEDKIRKHKMSFQHDESTMKITNTVSRIIINVKGQVVYKFRLASLVKPLLNSELIPCWCTS